MFVSGAEREEVHMRGIHSQQSAKDWKSGGDDDKQGQNWVIQSSSLKWGNRFWSEIRRSHSSHEYLFSFLASPHESDNQSSNSSTLPTLKVPLSDVLITVNFIQWNSHYTNIQVSFFRPRGTVVVFSREAKDSVGVRNCWHATTLEIVDGRQTRHRLFWSLNCTSQPNRATVAD